MIYVWIRQTLNWEEEGEFEAQLQPGLRPLVELWNETFELPFHRFRHRVAEIARISLSDVAGATTTTAWEEIPDGALVVPMDDDDWLPPYFGTALQAEFEPELVGYRWTADWIEVPMHPGHRLYLARRRLLPFWSEKYFCSTNNYAMRKGPDAKLLLHDHVQANKHFPGWKEDGRVKVIDRRLSVVNRTLASKTTLTMARPTMSHHELLRKCGRYRRLYRRRLPRRLSWCAPYVAMMGELMDDLSVIEAAAPRT